MTNHHKHGLIGLFVYLVLALFTSGARGQQVQPTPPTATAPTQTQIAACLAALPPEPKQPKPRGKALFPGLRQKIDDAIRKAGGDPDAMRAQADQAAKDEYQTEEQAYQKKRSACSAPVITPAAAEQVPATAPAAPPAEAKPTAPTPASSKPVLSADGRHLYVCPKGSMNAPDGLPVCRTPDGNYVPLQEIPIPAGALPPPAASQPPVVKKK
jgi:hypothetical protein